MHLTEALDTLCADLEARGIKHTRTPTLVHVLPGPSIHSIVIAPRDGGLWSAAPWTFGYAIRDADPLLAIRRVALDLHGRAKADRSRHALQALIDALDTPTPAPQTRKSALDTLSQLAKDLGVHAPGRDLAALAEAVAARVRELRRERDDLERLGIVRRLLRGRERVVRVLELQGWVGVA